MRRKETKDFIPPFHNRVKLPWEDRAWLFEADPSDYTLVKSRQGVKMVLRRVGVYKEDGRFQPYPSVISVIDMGEARTYFCESEMGTWSWKHLRIDPLLMIDANTKGLYTTSYNLKAKAIRKARLESSR